KSKEETSKFEAHRIQGRCQCDSSATRVGSVDGKIFTASLSEGPVKDWTKKVVVSKSPQDGKVCKFTVSLRTCPTLKPCQGVVHIIQTNDNAQRGRKRTLSVTEDSELGDLTPEEQQEVQEDPDADLNEDAGSDYKPDEDVDWAPLAPLAKGSEGLSG
ncbi:hypothetical protein M405DRAFT_820100, partial [Rhizopogon salebrosus TDB-379]